MIRIANNYAQLQCDGCRGYGPMTNPGPGYRQALERMGQRVGWQVSSNGVVQVLAWCPKCRRAEVRL